MSCRPGTARGTNQSRWAKFGLVFWVILPPDPTIASPSNIQDQALQPFVRPASPAGDVSSDRLVLDLGLWRLWEVQEEAASDRAHCLACHPLHH